MIMDYKTLVINLSTFGISLTNIDMVLKIILLSVTIIAPNPLDIHIGMYYGILPHKAIGSLLNNTLLSKIEYYGFFNQNRLFS